MIKAAPPDVRALLHDHKLRPQIFKYIKWLSYQKPQARKPVQRIYTDAQELKALEVCHPPCLGHLYVFLEALPHRQLFRAMDVAGGDGWLAENLFVSQYQRVDLFDACPVAVLRAKEKLSDWQNFGYAEEALMQDFRWHYKYSAIFMVWCIGYLEWSELVPFL